MLRDHLNTSHNHILEKQQEKVKAEVYICVNETFLIQRNKIENCYMVFKIHNLCNQRISGRKTRNNINISENIIM